jgi:hypothetical protein
MSHFSGYAKDECLFVHKTDSAFLPVKRKKFVSPLGRRRTESPGFTPLPGPHTNGTMNSPARPPAILSLLWVFLLGAVPLSCQLVADVDRDRIIYRYDMTHLYLLDLGDPEQARAAWDEAHLVSSLQGIVNRDAPVLFVRFMQDPDDFWFEHLRSPGEWLHGRPVVEVTSLEQLILTFRDRLSGFVVYSEDLASLSNLASTIAGVEDRVCLRFDQSEGSIHRRIRAIATEWDVLMLCREDGAAWFTGAGDAPVPGTEPPISSSGSAKGDAYLWLMQRYLDTGRTSPEFLAYYIDQYWLRHPRLASLENFTLTNHDFFISQRALFFDLGVWDDEAPVDDPDQPIGTDRAVLEAILARTAEMADGGILHIGGFTPWKWKYTLEAPGDSRHGAVATEWEKNKVASIYNAVIDSDALDLSGMANASFYQHHPMEEVYLQPNRPGIESLREGGYVTEEGEVAPLVFLMFYHGDYDSAAWLNRHVPRWWKDSARGTVPLNWAFNPNLDRRAPHALHYARMRQGENEWFIAGDSGAGYLNPGMLFAENRVPGASDGWDAWEAYCRRYYEKFDLSVTGFIIDGASPGMGEEGMNRYMTFSPDGIIGQKMPSQGVHRGVMPFIRMGADFHMVTPEAAAQRIIETTGELAGPRFMPLRTILMSPSWHREVMEEVAALPGGERVRFLDAYSFMLLLKTYELNKRQRPAPAGPFSGVPEIEYAPSSDGNGLWPVTVADGPFIIGHSSGRHFLRQTAQAAPGYLYFRVGDGFGRSAEWDGGTRVVVKLSVWDGGGGRVALEYNAPGDSYRMLEPPVELTGESRWREIIFSLPDARFEHGQNGGASFRIVNFGADLRVERVAVLRDF